MGKDRIIDPWPAATDNRPTERTHRTGNFSMDGQGRSQVFFERTHGPFEVLGAEGGGSEECARILAGSNGLRVIGLGCSAHTLLPVCVGRLRFNLFYWKLDTW